MKTTSKLSDKKCLAIVSINHMHPLRPLYTSLGSRGPNQIAEHHTHCTRWLGLVVCVRQLVLHKDSIEHETV